MEYLERIPEPAILSPQEELDFIRCNGTLLQEHPLVNLFSKSCPNFRGSLRILDIGCGTANMTAQFALAYPETKAVGVDASVVMFSHAKMLLKHFKLENRVSVRCAWLPDADFGEPDKSFDLIFTRSTLHHFKNPDDFWQVVKRYAKNDAAIFMVDLLRPTNKDELEKILYFRFGTEESPVKNAFRTSLLASYSIGEIKQQIDKIGLSLAAFFSSEDTYHVTIMRPGRFGVKI